MYYAVILQSDIFDFSQDNDTRPERDELIFDDVKMAREALKKYKGSRMKIFKDRDEAVDFLNNTQILAPDISFCDLDTSNGNTSQGDLVASLKDLSLNEKVSSNNLSSTPKKTPNKQQQQQVDSPQQAATAPKADEVEPSYPEAKPALLNSLRRRIEAGDYEEVENIIWSNPRCLINCCDSAVYLMAGPKYNACHIAARANKPDIMGLVLDTVTNFKFLRKLYPNEADDRLQDRINHLLDSYLNTPDPRQGNTPLHFACKFGHYKVVRVLLTFEGCDLSLRDSNGLTAEEGACTQFKQQATVTTTHGDNKEANSCDRIREKILKLFKHQLHMPAFRDQLRKRLTMERRRHNANTSANSSLDSSFSDIDDSFIYHKKS